MIQNKILTTNLGIIEDGLFLERLLDLARKGRSAASLDHRQHNTDLFGHRGYEEMAILVLQVSGRGKRGRKSIPDKVLFIVWTQRLPL